MNKDLYLSIINSASLYYILVVIAFLLLYIAFYKKPKAAKK